MTRREVRAKLARGISSRHFKEYLQSGWTFTERQAEVIGYVCHRLGMLPDFRVPVGMANAVLKSRGNDIEDVQFYRELQYMEQQHRIAKKLKNGGLKDSLKRGSQISGSQLFTGV